MKPFGISFCACQGDYLDTIRGEKLFSSIASYESYCFFGTNTGSVMIYDMKQIHKINEIGYASEVRESFSLDNANNE